ncbi:MAG: capsular biosynthesis protein [Gammaproteobacteria bacterium]|nr:MAG: capsular biosynthesis protein [Gammaproteobacteria bacterium]
MYDLHCHILPAFDDGAKDIDTALAMARIAVDDGITHLACTPHIYPGLFENNTQGIKSALETFSSELDRAAISLELSIGADIQIIPELLGSLQNGAMPTINGSRYFLLEPPHHIPSPHIEQMVFDVVAAGYVPIVTHPERLEWLDDHYDTFLSLADHGAWMQLTSGSITGRFGDGPKYWSEKMLDDGIVYLIATDAHNMTSRAPLLAEGAEAAARWVGQKEARALVYDRPKAVWKNQEISTISLPPAYNENGKLRQKPKKRFFKRMFGR